MKRISHYLLGQEFIAIHHFQDVVQRIRHQTAVNHLKESM